MCFFPACVLICSQKLFLHLAQHCSGATECSRATLPQRTSLCAPRQLPEQFSCLGLVPCHCLEVKSFIKNAIFRNQRKKRKGRACNHNNQPGYLDPWGPGGWCPAPTVRALAPRAAGGCLHGPAEPCWGCRDLLGTAKSHINNRGTMGEVFRKTEIQVQHLSP